ncbi:LOW QUALITY PROTEIN: ubiquitin specific peptidase echinus [Aphomia sociella]
MIKFRYKRKESNDGGAKNGTAIQKKVEGLWDRELLPPKDLLTSSVAGVRNNTLPRSRPPSAARREVIEQAPLLSATTLTLFRELFTQLQWSAERAPAADALRRALGGGGARFQLGCMADASECFEHLLLRVHAHVATTAADRKDEDACRAAHCVPHRKFAMMLIEQSVCGSCKATSKPLRFTQMVHYVSATALTAQAALGQHGDSFGLLLKQAGGMGDIRDCPIACGAKIQICRTLINRPEILSIGMVWDSERPSAEHVAAVYAALGTELCPADAFHACAEWAWAARATHRLVGLVTYYGKHYSTFFFHSKLRLWIYFDDADVKEIGPEWSQVVDKCCKGRFQPLLLLYAAVDGTPCDTRHAPKDVVPFPAPEPRRAITPAPDRHTTQNYARRAVTPGPDTENDYISRKAVENILESNRHTQLGRSMSTGSGSDSSGPRVRRDSGNWSGDRNSASSASSSMESPYIYTRNRGPGSVPSSPTRKGELSSGGSCDAGYDSYSLSSTDSLPLQQGIRNMHLAPIPDIKARGNCEALCLEADRLLEKSRHAEDAADYETAVVLCDAATSKARAAMEAPYNNQHTMTVARMKHNTCVMRSRSLQRRMAGKCRVTEIPHLAPVRNTKGGLESSPTIEIYATLPKKKTSKKSPKSIEDDINNPPCERPPRHKSREDEKVKEKRSRSEDRGRARKEVSVTIDKKDEITTEDKKANKKQHKIRRKLLMGGLIRRKNRSMPDLTEGADGNKETTTKDKRISSIDDGEVGRRKTEDKVNLSGYLSEGHLEYSAASVNNPTLEKSKLMRKSIHGSVGKILTATKAPPPPLRTTSQLSGPKFDQEVIEHITQCHPQPSVNRGEFSYAQDNEEDGGFSEHYGDEPQSLPFLPSSYDNQQVKPYRIDDSPAQNFQMIVTKAMIHQEQSPVKRETISAIQPTQNSIQNLSNAFNHGVDEVDCAVPSSRRSPHMFDLPPYPSPMNSVNHSRQPSEEFPPPPPPIDLTPLEEELHNRQHINEYNLANSNEVQIPKGSLLAQLQEKRNQILRNNEGDSRFKKMETMSVVCDSLLQELQAKQAAIKLKRSNSLEGQLSGSCENSRPKGENTNIVKQNKQLFENIGRNISPDVERSHIGYVEMRDNRDVINCSNQPSTCMYNRRTSSSSIDPKQLQDEYNDQQQSINSNTSPTFGDHLKPKKKSVSFCDHVVIVSSKAEDEEDNNYIPNIILERVLKSAMNKLQTTTMPLQSDKSTLQRQDSFDSQSSRSTTLSASQNSTARSDNERSEYLRIHDIPFPTYQTHQQQFNPQGMYERRIPLPPLSPNQNSVNTNQAFAPVPTGVPKNATSPIPYNQPPSAYPKHNATPPNIQNTFNRAIPIEHKPFLVTKRMVNNLYHQQLPHDNSNSYQISPQQSSSSTLTSNLYTANRQTNPNMQSNTSPYLSVPTNSPAYQSYHTPPTNYASSEYSSRYPVNSTNHYSAAHTVYQRVPPPHGDAPVDNYNGSYHKTPNNAYLDNNSNQSLASDVRHYANSQQQRPVHNQTFNMQNNPSNNDSQYQYAGTQNNYNVYDHMPQPKQLQKKSVSFEPGTKGGTDSPVPPQFNGNTYYSGENVQTNTASGQITLCNLCRKKVISSSLLYCPDCDFYMSRFKPRPQNISQASSSGNCDYATN